MSIDTNHRWMAEGSHDHRCAHALHGDQSGTQDEAPLDTGGALFASGAPSTVWFGPPGHKAVEAELLEFLGSHDGVAVLQWSRDRERGAHLSDLGIPCLWFIEPGDKRPLIGSGLHEWLPRNASCEQVRASLARLSQRPATPRDTGRSAPGAHDRLGRRREQCSNGTLRRQHD
jgi:hypothetical protein